jgi:hypothetical protein
MIMPVAFLGLTATTTSSLELAAPSLAVSRNVYEPAVPNAAVVFNEFAFPKVTVPGPLTVLHVVVTVDGGAGSPSSVAVPVSDAVPPRVIV